MTIFVSTCHRLSLQGYVLVKLLRNTSAQLLAFYFHYFLFLSLLVFTCHHMSLTLLHERPSDEQRQSLQRPVSALPGMGQGYHRGTL